MPLGQELLAWGTNVSSEVAFWEEWFDTKGGDWPSDYARRLNPSEPFDATLLEGIVLDASATPRVLDVGAGPATTLGKIHLGRGVEITAIDPLSPFYSAIIRRCDVSLPVPTRQGFGETLSLQFQSNSFDLSFCRNALDHALDPLTCLEEMMIVTRIGGRIVLEHFENEAETQGYDGLHQWNFSEEQGCFVVWNLRLRVNITEKYADVATIIAKRVVYDGSGPDTIVAEILKTSDLAIDLVQRSRDRVSEVLGAALFVSTMRAGDR